MDKNTMPASALSMVLRAGGSSAQLLRHNGKAATSAATLAAMSALTAADPVEQNFPHWLSVVISVFSILIGTILLTHGYKFFKFGVFAVCAYLSGQICWQILLAALADNDASKDTFLYVCSGVVGVIGGLMAIYWLPIAIFAMGFAVGGMLAVALNPVILHRLIPSNPAATLFIFVGVLGLVFGALTLYFERYVLIAASCLTGALVILYNIGTMAGSFPTYDRLKNHSGALPWQWWAYFGGFIGLAAVGFAVHMVLHKDCDHREAIKRHKKSKK